MNPTRANPRLTTKRVDGFTPHEEHVLRHAGEHGGVVWLIHGKTHSDLFLAAYSLQRLGYLWPTQQGKPEERSGGGCDLLDQSWKFGLRCCGFCFVEMMLADRCHGAAESKSQHQERCLKTPDRAEDRETPEEDGYGREFVFLDEPGEGLDRGCGEGGRRDHAAILLSSIARAALPSGSIFQPNDPETNSLVRVREVTEDLMEAA